MTLREFLNTCGNDWKFIKIWVADDMEVDDFDKCNPDYVYSDMRAIPEFRLEKTIDCWYVEDNSIYILM